MTILELLRAGTSELHHGFLYSQEQVLLSIYHI